MNKNITDQRFKQEALPSAQNNTITSQRILVKIFMTILVMGLYFLLSIPAAYFGCISALFISIKSNQYFFTYISLTLCLFIWLITAIYRTFSQSLLIWALSLLIVIVGCIFLAKLNLLTITDKSKFLVNTPFLSFFGLACCSISFVGSRVAIAFFDILFSKPKWLKIISFFPLILAAYIGVNTGIGNVIIDPSIRVYFGNLTAGEQAIIKAIAVTFGYIYALGLALSGWLVNHQRNVPWNHPDLLRDWVLAIGSWSGKSFFKLDLSGVNFRNAKLANTDLRARKLYRTCFQGVTGLERARVDSRYLDLEIPKVQKLLTHACSEDPDFSNLNLRGAYLKGADLRHIKFIDTVLTGADLQGADLRGSILANAQVIDVDFTNANLTGICIPNWNVNSQTCFTNVECDYIYRKLDEKGEPIDRHPLDRNFEPREFESLYQEVGNIVELVFKEGVNWRAFAFSLQKLELEDESLGLELKGIEKKGDLWVAKVTHNENISHAEVEKRLNDSYEELKQRLSTKEQQINSLLGIASTQAETIKEFSKRPFGNSFVINGSTITNLTGSGQIEYNEAAEQVRSLVANGTEPVQVSNIVQHLLAQLQGQSVATTAGTQAELIKQLLLNEAEKDSVFKQLLVLQSQQIIDTLPEGAIATAMKQAIAQLQRSSTNS